jgi:hypothetical protein
MNKARVAEAVRGPFILKESIKVEIWNSDFNFRVLAELPLKIGYSRQL